MHASRYHLNCIDSWSAMKLLVFLLALIALPCRAVNFSDIPKQSIDTMFETCFADAQCAGQLAPLIAQRATTHPDLEATLHHCLDNARFMAVCGQFSSTAARDELARDADRFKAAVGERCLGVALTAGQVRLKKAAEVCWRDAESHGAGMDSTMHASSCFTDMDRGLILQLRNFSGCKACGPRAARCARFVAGTKKRK